MKLYWSRRIIQTVQSRDTSACDPSPSPQAVGFSIGLLPTCGPGEVGDRTAAASILHLPEADLDQR